MILLFPFEKSRSFPDEKKVVNGLFRIKYDGTALLGHDS